MPESWTLTIPILLLSLALIQGALVVGFLVALARRPKPCRSQLPHQSPSAKPIRDLENIDWPKVRVVLCVRGADPSLERCVAAIAKLDYPSYRLTVVADDPLDPGLDMVRRALVPQSDEFAEFVLLQAQDRLESCSMKCSALVRACRDLPEDVQIIATIDADTHPGRQWLKDLVLPLIQDQRVGATTGIRWYSPRGRSLGEWTRMVWNAAAIVQMWAYSIPWGGSMAVRRGLLNEAGLLDRWRTTFCEDTPTASQLRRHGYKIRTVTHLVLDNDERCSFKEVGPWIRRQLLTARLHHPAWSMVLGHAVSTTAAPLLALLVGLAALAFQSWTEAAWILGSLLAYEILMLGLVLGIARGIHQRLIESADHYEVPPGIVPLLTAISIGIVASQAAYPKAAFGATFASGVTWRQIRYAILPKGKIRRLNYAPFQAEGQLPSESI